MISAQIYVDQCDFVFFFPARTVNVGFFADAAVSWSLPAAAWSPLLRHGSVINPLTASARWRFCCWVRIRISCEQFLARIALLTIRAAALLPLPLPGLGISGLLQSLTLAGSAQTSQIDWLVKYLRLGCWMEFLQELRRNPPPFQKNPRRSPAYLQPPLELLWGEKIWRIDHLMESADWLWQLTKLVDLIMLVSEL